MFSGLKILSIYDPALKLVVQLNKISPDGEIKIAQPLTTEVVNGGQIYSGDESYIKIESYDMDQFTQLETWMKNKTPLRAVGYGIDEHLLWYEDSYLTVQKNFKVKPGERNSMTVRMQRKGGVHNIKTGRNLVYLHAGWADKIIVNEIADNYELIGNEALHITPSFDQGQQKLVANDDGAIGIDFVNTDELIFPVSGVDLYFTGNIDVGTMSSPQVKRITIAKTNNEETNYDSFYDIVTQITTPENTYSFSFSWLHEATFGTREQCMIFSSPYMGVERTDYEILD